ncbi:MAG TPA: pilus assembly protein PilM [Polyangiaceae bacterium]
MARLVGIEVSTTHVRAVTLVTSYRRMAVERMLEVDRSQTTDLTEALRLAASSMTTHGESVALAIEGTGAYIQRIDLPRTALRQLDQVVPFELESRVPVDLDELVHDYTLLRSQAGDRGVRLLAAAAPLERVQAVLKSCREAVGREVERVGCGPLPYANLIGLLGEAGRSEAAVAIVDLGLRRIDVLIVQAGEAVFARTTSTGIAMLPEGAVQIAASIRQTLMAFESQGGPTVTTLYLTGEGASVSGAEAYLSSEIHVPVLGLPMLAGLEVAEGQQVDLPRFSKAIAIALGLGARPRDPDLRQGPLGFQRGYAFLKEKAPVLSGLVTAILISFAFSAWSESKALEKQRETLVTELGQVTKTILGEETTDVEAATELLQKRRSAEDTDPMPHMDAFDVLVEVSSAIPQSIIHDVEEFDMQRERVKLTGIVSSASEAQEIASKLKEHRCFQEQRLGKVTQVVNSDRQKYGLEWDVRCPEDQASKPAKKKAEEPTGGAK